MMIKFRLRDDSGDATLRGSEDNLNVNAIEFGNRRGIEFVKNNREAF